ncbi:MAG: PH domain-containing protein [Gammaproteobacteria bacterium]|nr:PH domain-containing protein [Gammaproteobacteria bacterium]
MISGTWHRLSPLAVVYLFLRGTIGIARENLPLLFGAGAGVALFDAIGLREVALLAAVLLIIGFVVALLQYRRFMFRIDGDLLLVRKGILEQSELKVRSAQIQQVMVEAPWHLRAFGLVRFSVDTPGGAATEVELPGIRPATAEALRRALEPEGRVLDPAAAPTPNRIALHRASGIDLVLHGLANNYAWVALAALMPLFHRLSRSHEERLAEFDLPPWLEVLLEQPLLAAGGGLAAMLLTLMVASVIIAVLRFHGFVLERDGGRNMPPRFRQTSGWASRREQILNGARLQVVEHVQTPIGRLLGRSHLLCRQIGSVQIEQDPGGQLFIIPGLTARKSADLLAELWSGRASTATLERVHLHYRRIMWLRLTGVAAVLLGVIAGQVDDWRWWLLMLVFTPLFAGLAHLRWLSVGYAMRDGWLQIRVGLLGRRTSHFPAANVQRIQLRQNWFQRRRKVADLILTLATGPITVPCLPEERAWGMLEDVLERIEGPVLPAVA